MRLITRAAGASGGDGCLPASAHCNSHSNVRSLALKPLTPCRRQCPQPPSAASGQEGGSGGGEGAAARRSASTQSRRDCTLRAALQTEVEPAC